MCLLDSKTLDNADPQHNLALGKGRSRIVQKETRPIHLSTYKLPELGKTEEEKEAD